ncbi:MAG: tetratricopeptide repeat protein, partial [Gammaproteobacteria bacterium]|nr:tetratricopeptide repeat protein [Gammaproteobacteria bacterium]
MMQKLKTFNIVKVGFVCAMLSSGTAIAVDSSLDGLSDKQRIQRIERMLNANVLRGQMQTVQSLQEEIAALREQVEQQEYELDSMKQRQRNLYLDIDRRINNVETGGRGRVKTSSPVPPPNSSMNKKVVPVSVAGNSDGQQVYSKAFALLKEGQYKQSITAFESFKKTYPDSKYADNAQYWLGEANYVSRAYKKALEAFQQLIARYPESTKNAGARLKIGYVSPDLNNHSIQNCLLPILANHNKDKFEIFAFADLEEEDLISQQYKLYVDHWIRTEKMTDNELVNIIRIMQIDIL